MTSFLTLWSHNQQCTRTWSSTLQVSKLQASKRRRKQRTSWNFARNHRSLKEMVWRRSKWQGRTWRISQITSQVPQMMKRKPEERSARSLMIQYQSGIRSSTASCAWHHLMRKRKSRDRDGMRQLSKRRTSREISPSSLITIGKFTWYNLTRDKRKLRYEGVKGLLRKIRLSREIRP